MRRGSCKMQCHESKELGDIKRTFCFWGDQEEVEEAGMTAMAFILKGKLLVKRHFYVWCFTRYLLYSFMTVVDYFFFLYAIENRYIFIGKLCYGWFQQKSLLYFKKEIYFWFRTVMLPVMAVCSRVVGNNGWYTLPWCKIRA